jgi:uncharacterized membrane protein YgcG
MSKLSTLILCCIVSAAALVTATPAARAAKAQVVDNAGFFSADAVSKANQQLADLEQRSGKQLRIETYAQLPNELRGQYSPQRSNEIYDKWATQLAKDQGINGALVVITRQPGHMHAIVGRGTNESGVFTTTDRDRLRDILTGAFQAKNYDQGLQSAVDFWQQKVGNASNNSAAGAAASSRRLQHRGASPLSFPQ